MADNAAKTRRTTHAKPGRAPAGDAQGLRTFRAATMAEALSEVKKTLGSDAVILRTRSTKVGGVLGVGARPVVEITASADPAVAAVAAPRRARPAPSPTSSSATSPPKTPMAPARSDAPEASVDTVEFRSAPAPAPAPAAFATPSSLSRPAAITRPSAARALLSKDEPLAPSASASAVSGASVSATPVSPAPVDHQAVRQLEEEMRAMRAMMGEVLQASRSSAPAVAGTLAELGPRGEALAASGLPEAVLGELSRAIARELSPAEQRDEQIVRAVLGRLLGDLVPTGGTIEPKRGETRVVAMVGPTGVGKTTTIAKLAAELKLRRGMRVGLITADTYRIAAVEQLRTYAGIIGLPLRVVLGPDELVSARAALEDRDVILVDTAGRSPRDASKLAALKELVGAARADEVHLVLSSSMGASAAARAVERFAAVAGDRQTLRVILSKVDEADEIGAVLGVVRTLGAPVSYLTTGQEVPDDIEPASASRIVEALLGSELEAAGATA